MKAVPHPIPYQGSKRNLAPAILRYFAKDINRLVEPFAGSAALSIAAAAQGLAQRFWLNDLNRPLVDLLKQIVEQPEALAAFYEQLWNQQQSDSLGHYYQVRDEFNRTQDPPLFLYLLARCVKSSVRYNTCGLFNQSPDKRRQGTRPDTLRNNIHGVSGLLQGKTEFSSLDYREVLKTVEPGDLVYLDPPYQGVCGKRDARYYSGISHAELVDALQALNSKGILFIVSYDGRRGDNAFGEPFPESIGLTRIEIDAGRSSQSTLLGFSEVTFESLYLSPALTEKLNAKPVARMECSSIRATLANYGIAEAVMAREYK